MSSALKSAENAYYAMGLNGFGCKSTTRPSGGATGVVVSQFRRNIT